MSPPQYAPDTGSREQALDRIVSGELTVIQEKRIILQSRDKPGFLHRGVLFSCILVNIIFLVTVADYPALFIAASFYLNMFYFIVLLIPARPGTALSKTEITRFHHWLRDVGVKSGTSRFTRLFINSFFMNSRALSPGIGLLFSVDILFALFSYIFRDLPLIITVIVIAQCGVIILFYLIVWMVEPFSTGFRHNIDLVRKRLYREKIPPWMVSLIFMTGILFAVFLFLTAIILLPGMTVTAFMSQSGLNKLAYLILFITILAVSQYFLIRSIHGTTSRAMAERILDFQEDSLRELGRLRDDRRTGTLNEAGERTRQTDLLFASAIYSVREHTLLGKFPVYTVDIDIPALMDIMRLSATGHTAEDKNGII